MISGATWTNFNIQHYHATCIEIDIHVVCNNFSASQTNDDTICIKVGI